MKELIENIYKELAEIKDSEERLIQKQRADSLLAKYDGADRVVSYAEYKTKSEKERSKKVERFMSKIPTLDRCTLGFKPGDLVVISAPTGTGKTTFAQTLIENFSESGINSLLFSYEVRPEEMPWTDKVNMSMPLDLKGDTMDWLEKKILEAKVKFDAKAVFIDHLHYISDVMSVGKGQNQSTVIGITMNRLATMAQKWDVCIFLIAHLKKTKFDAMPDMSDLRDSSFIAQYASIVMMLVRERQPEYINGNEYTKLSNITITNILKCRGVGRDTDVFQLQFNDDNKLHELLQTTSQD